MHPYIGIGPNRMSASIACKPVHFFIVFFPDSFQPLEVSKKVWVDGWGGVLSKSVQSLVANYHIYRLLVWFKEHPNHPQICKSVPSEKAD